MIFAVLFKDIAHNDDILLLWVDCYADNPIKQEMLEKWLMFFFLLHKFHNSFSHLILRLEATSKQGRTKNLKRRGGGLLCVYASKVHFARLSACYKNAIDPIQALVLSQNQELTMLSI